MTKEEFKNSLDICVKAAEVRKFLWSKVYSELPNIELVCNSVETIKNLSSELLDFIIKLNPRLDEDVEISEEESVEFTKCISKVEKVLKETSTMMNIVREETEAFIFMSK